MKLMEEHFKNEDQLLKKLIQETELEKPSFQFSNNVMEKINANESKVKYTPLLPKFWKIFIPILLVVSMGWLFFNPSSSFFQFNSSFDIIDSSNWELDLPNLSLSKTGMYAILFLGLFLFQIPYLKRLLDKHYS